MKKTHEMVAFVIGVVSCACCVAQGKASESVSEVAPEKSGVVAIRSESRLAFVRGEENAKIVLSVQNDSTQNWAAVTLSTPFGEKALGEIGAGQHAAASFGIETRVKPSSRPFVAKAAIRTSAGEALSAEASFAVLIGPRLTPGTMSIALTDTTKAQWDMAKAMGFTKVGNAHDVGGGARRETIADGGACEDLIRTIRARHDEALFKGLRTGISSRGVLLPKGYDGHFTRKRRDGTAVEGNAHAKIAIEFGHPDALAYVKKVAEENAADVASHPGMDSLYPSSEVRDKSTPSFNTEHLRYKAQTGRDVPDGVAKRTCDKKKMRKVYPDGIVPDDDPVLAYYRWFWKDGDGMSSYLKAQAAPYNAIRGCSEDFYTMWAPAVRCPPIWGSGVGVDAIKSWSYAVPDAMNVGGITEDLLAMAEGCPGQQVITSTQLIIYRRSAAPVKQKDVRPAPAWLSKFPNVDFLAIPPDVLKETTWTMLAKPSFAVTFYGAGCVDKPQEGVYTGKGGYRATCPGLGQTMHDLNWNVIRPLGPALRKIGREQPKVAVLQSFTTCIMGGAHMWGWHEPAVSLLQRARLDPRVVYEEAILRGDLKDVSVLYAPSCEFLTPSVLAKIREFQSAGGVLVADGDLLSALSADITIPVVKFPKVPKIDLPKDVDAAFGKPLVNTRAQEETLKAKRGQLEICGRLRRELAGKFQPRLDSSDPEIVTYARRWRDTDYAFVVNDKRTFGDYIGQWGLVQEKGLPNAGKVTLADADSRVRHVYELSRGGEVAFTHEDGKVVLPVSFETTDGRLYAFLSQKIAKVEVSSTEIRPGAAFEVTVRVLDEKGEPIHAVLPAELHVYDAAGAELDGAGFIATENGVAKVKMLANLDDAPGGYRLVAKDRASGLVAERK